MSLNKTFSYHFTIKRGKKNKKGLIPIYLRIVIDGKRIEISTKQSIHINKWINSATKLTSEKSVNMVLKSMERNLYNIYNSFVVKEIPITAMMIKNEMLGIKEKEHTLINSLEYHNKLMGAQLGIKYSKGTLKNYRTTLKYMKEFIPFHYKVDDLPLTKLNYEFATSYELYLTTVKNCTNNGVMKQIQRIKKVINMAIANEWLNRDPFIKFKVNYVNKDRGYLTFAELNKIASSLLCAKLAIVRDYFVFSCYTGLAYIDIKNLTEQNIELDDLGNEWIIINRKKTKIQAIIPILPKAKKLLTRYRLHKQKESSIFPVMSNQKTNDYLKEIAKLCKIDKRISYHLARHTFATTVTLSNGVPIETVSKMLGHTKITTTQIYGRVLKTKILKDMGKLK